MPQNPPKTKKGILFFCYFGLFLIVLFLVGKYRDHKLSSDGRFTVGIIDSYQNSKSGQIYSVHYFFEKQKYTMSFSDFGPGFDTGQLVFLEISASNPKVYKILDYLKIKVPSCIKISDVPVNGWTKMPLDACK